MSSHKPPERPLPVVTAQKALTTAINNFARAVNDVFSAPNDPESWTMTDSTRQVVREWERTVLLFHTNDPEVQLKVAREWLERSRKAWEKAHRRCYGDKGIHYEDAMKERLLGIMGAEVRGMEDIVDLLEKMEQV